MSNVRYFAVAVLLMLSVALFGGAALANYAWGPLSDEERPIPAGLAWDQSYAAQLWVMNMGSTDWDVSYGVLCVDSSDPMNSPLINTWTSTSGTMYTSYDPTGPNHFAMTLIAPPISPITYSAGVAVADPLPCYWVLARNGTRYPVTPLGRDVQITRFTDMAGSFFAPQVEQLAGLFPAKIVGGFDDGTYRPGLNVDRATMSVFLQRALKLPTTAYQAYFSDVTKTNCWAWSQIEALKTANLVKGFDDGTYKPTEIVARDTMAVYVARALVGSTTMPTTPATASFTDVPVGNWAFSEVEYCKAAGVVNGTSATTYSPGEAVVRGTMALFIYRAFVQPNPSIIVMAGPATTNSDTSAQVGVPSVAIDPMMAYVGFDGIRMDPAGMTVDFAAKAADDTVTPIGSFEVDPSIATPASPIIYAGASLASLAPGDYTLVVSIGGVEITSHPVSFTISPPAP